MSTRDLGIYCSEAERWHKPEVNVKQSGKPKGVEKSKPKQREREEKKGGRKKEGKGEGKGRKAKREERGENRQKGEKGESKAVLFYLLCLATRCKILFTVLVQ